MAQPPFLIDQIDIEPGSTGTRRINRDAGTGGLAFEDPVVSGPLTLANLAGLRNISNVLIVGTSGDGAQYTGSTAIQDALDAVPANASSTNPYIILVLPGRYDETVNIVRDGVRLVGLGRPEIRSALEATPDAVGADHTVIISAQLGTIPLSVLIEGFVISNAHSGQAAVRISGGAASTLASDGVVVRNCSLRANSTVGNYSLWATACNTVHVEGGSWQESNNLGVLRLEEVSSFIASGVGGLGALSLRYSTAQAVPVDGSGSYAFNQCPNIAQGTALPSPVSSDCTGGGSVEFNNCSLGNAVFSGDQSLTARSTTFGDLSLQGSTAASLSNCARGALVVNALATLDEASRSGVAVFGAVTTMAVVFDVPFSDNAYQVSLELDSRPASDETAWVTLKGASGFTINFQSAQTLSVNWKASRSDM